MLDVGFELMHHCFNLSSVKITNLYHMSFDAMSF